MAFLERNANRGSISTDYDIDNSLKVEADNSESLTRTPSSAGNRKTWTLSFWLKRTELSATMRVVEAWDSSAGTSGLFNTSNQFLLDLNSGSNYFTSSRQFRDCSAWYHFVIRVDTTSGTASERARVYVNGEELTGSWTGGNIGQNTDLTWNQNVVHYLGVFHNSDQFVSGYYAEVINIDGSSFGPTTFGRVDANGVWVPKDANGSGTNGFKLEFQSSGSLGADTSGNSNTWTLNNIAAIDQATDTPTNNFCTMNENARTNGNIRTQEGGTFVTTDGGSGWCSMLGSMAMSAGKWYWEALVWDNSDALTVYVGIAPHNDPYIPHSQGGYYLGNVETAGSMGWYLSDGSNKNQNGSWGNPARGDKLMFAYDADNYKMYYGINGTWGNSANPANGTGTVTAISSYWMSALKDPLDFVLPAVTVYQGKGMKGFNFGGYCAWTIDSGNADANGYGNFEYAPPTGFYALCTKNLAQYGG